MHAAVVVAVLSLRVRPSRLAVAVSVTTIIAKSDSCTCYPHHHHLIITRFAFCIRASPHPLSHALYSLHDPHVPYVMNEVLYAYLSRTSSHLYCSPWA